MAKDATVLAVYEDWEGGAGNALGTLYAYKKAAALAEFKGYDLSGKLKAGEVRRNWHKTRGLAGDIVKVVMLFSLVRQSKNEPILILEPNIIFHS